APRKLQLTKKCPVGRSPSRSAFDLRWRLPVRILSRLDSRPSQAAGPDEPGQSPTWLVSGYSTADKVSGWECIFFDTLLKIASDAIGIFDCTQRVIEKSGFFHCSRRAWLPIASKNIC